MIEKYSAKNYALFPKYLGKISKETADKFSGLDNIIIFLLELCNCGYISLAAKKIELRSPFISPLLLHKIINSDRHLSKCVSLAKGYATEMAKYQANAANSKNMLINDKKQEENCSNLKQLNEIDVFEVEAYEQATSDEEASS